MTRKVSRKHRLRQAVSITSYYSGLCSLSGFLKWTTGARILCFHGINPAPSNQYAVSASDFALQMQFLAEHYKVISIDHLVRTYLADGEASAKLIAISIDDGFQDFYQHGYPVLRQHGIPATVFLPTGAIDKDSDYANILPQSDFLNWDQIREMQQHGIDFGSHTVSHKSVTRLLPQEIQYELEYSKRRLESELSVAIKGFSYPYGTFRDFAPRLEKILTTAGYDWAVTAISGVNKTGQNPFALRRTVIVREDGLVGFKRALKGSLDGWIIMQKMGHLL